ncbi:hypothetical protein [Limosilactobacillus pontis]|uniref:HTH cro/C1-type domain-containing protein n=1 Tax=Limosilactobacillus pontis DSM 8475 TaxID=1423794 RepID=A0A922TNQ4_9LACO|nr:hypothetical protein [Limosilactobacillus pontis]KRM37533.1 hypothetical protein FD34_GL001283 [Limosilactobacillus pontis DSM 8475]
MTTWNDIKKKLTSIKPDEMTAIESLAHLHTQRIKRGTSQVELAKRIGMKQPLNR